MIKYFAAIFLPAFLFADSMEIVPTIVQDPSSSSAISEYEKKSPVIKSSGPVVKPESAVQDDVSEIMRNDTSSKPSSVQIQPQGKPAVKKENARASGGGAENVRKSTSTADEKPAPKARKSAKKASASKKKEKKSDQAKLNAPATEDRAVLESGIMFYNSGNYAAAIEKLKQMKEKFPSSPYVDLASQWLARSYLKIGDSKNAEASLQSIPAESGEYPAAIFYSGQIAFARKDYSSAADKFYRVSAVYATHELADDALVSLARTNVVMGNGSQAIENLLKVIRNYPDRETVDDAYYNLARVYEDDAKLRDLERARDVYKKFVAKAEEGDAVFLHSPLLSRVKRDLDYLNKKFFSEGPLK